MRRGIVISISLMPVVFAVIGLIWPDAQFAVTVLGVSIVIGAFLYAVFSMALDD